MRTDSIIENDFDFVTLSHANKLVNWDQAQQFNLLNGELQQFDSL